jgi:uncharacterized coiled-coil protein SlyX
MGMVAAQQRIASAYFVIFGNYGDVRRYALERGVCRQWVYREAASVEQALAEHQKTIERLQARLGELEQQHTELQEPEGLHWWDVLKWSPEQLRDRLSTAKKAA